MGLFFLITLLFAPLVTSDHNMNLDGTIGDFRFAYLSNNTLTEKIDTLATTGSDLHLIGSIEINLFDNTGSGSVYLSNYEFNDTYTLFTAINLSDHESQVSLQVESDTNTNGTGASPARILTPALKVLLRTTVGEITNDRIILDFYAKDSVYNVLTADNYFANFQINWED